MEDLLKKVLENALKKAYPASVEDIHIEHPDNSNFGDYSTNLPLILASKVKQSPMEIAKNIVYEIDVEEIQGDYRKKSVRILKSVEIAQPGFINFVLSEEWLHKLLNTVIVIGENYGRAENLKNRNVILEYTDPNPFKVFHIGHLMTNAIGETLSRLYEFQGANVKRANYQGDIGMHVAKSIWGLNEILVKNDTDIHSIGKKPLEERIDYLGKAYALGAKRSNEDPAIEREIKGLNLKLYYVAQQYLSEKEGWAPLVNYKKLIEDFDEIEMKQLSTLYKEGRSWSLEYFETLYKRLGTKFDYYFFESVVGELGMKIVKNALKKGVFEENEGAVIFKGEKYGLHTRVFLNSLGLPVYEAKDLGLAFLKYEHFIYDESVIITANEINEYFKVVIKAMEKIEPNISGKTIHIGHGMMKFKHGKMSSRTGDVISGVSLLDDLQGKVKKIIKESSSSAVSSEDIDKVSDSVAVAAIKYAVLKHGIGNDIVYDEKEILNLSGNSGPYLLYTYARTNSLLEKAGIKDISKLNEYDYKTLKLNDQEKSLLRAMYKFPEYVDSATESSN
ncbi:arginine--tRNA ligase [Patescibacteria group bacterium]